MTVCLGAAADGRRLLASSIGCSRQSCGSAGNQASMLLYWLPQQPKWLAVPSSCTTFVTAAAQTHFGDRRHRQLRWRSFIKRQQAYTAICKEISGGSKETVVAYGDAKFSSSCCKGNPAHLQCHCGGNLGTAVRCMTRMNFAQASFVVLARQPWMACLSLS